MAHSARHAGLLYCSLCGQAGGNRTSGQALTTGPSPYYRDVLFCHRCYDVCFPADEAGHVKPEPSDAGDSDLDSEATVGFPCTLCGAHEDRCLFPWPLKNTATAAGLEAWSQWELYADFLCIECHATMTGSTGPCSESA